MDRAGEAEEVHFPDFGHMLGFNPIDEDHFAVAQGMRVSWKKKLYLLMEEPSSGREAFFVHVLVTGGILFRYCLRFREYFRAEDRSAVLTTLSTLPSFHTDPSHIRALFGLDTTIVVLFTIEYLARTLAHSDSWSMYYKWATSFFPLLDLIAILPYYIEVARQEDTSILFRFSILRTFRLLRVFRAFKYQNQMLLTIEVMYVAVQRSKDALVALSFFILLVLVFFATLIYFAERGTWDANLQAFIDADGDPSLFDSIPQTAWFALVTMSTVGYGDVVPRSSLGKLLTVPLLMFGLLLIALPSFVLGRNFAIVFDAMTTQAHKPVSSTGLTMLINTDSSQVSPDASPRHSVESRPPSPVDRLPNPEHTTSAPLLPTTSADAVTPFSQQPRARATTPNLVPSNSANQRPMGNTPRMWDGGFDGAEAKAARADLTNVKLAKNQIVRLFFS
jgi:voltage-gated potassium channel Kch